MKSISAYKIFAFLILGFIIFKFDFFTGGFKYFYLNIENISELEPAETDWLFTLIFFPLIPLAALIIEKKSANYKTAGFIILSLSIFFFPQFIAPFHPNYQTKLSNKSIFSESEFYIRKDTPEKLFIKARYLNVQYNYLETEPGNGYRIKKIHILGTDKLGRDIFSRLIYGIRVSLIIGISSLIINFIIGCSLGFISGISKSIAKGFLNTISDTLLAFPMLFLALMLLMVLGNQPLTLILFLGGTGWMGLYKIVRDETLIIKKMPYFISSEMLGLNRFSLFIKEILPVVKGIVLVNLTFQFCNIILAESALGFIGINAFGDIPTLGRMIYEGQNYLSESLISFIAPGASLVFLLLSINEVSNELKEKFAV